MTAQYAKNQPAGFKNRVENVAIVGIGGNSGGYMASALLQTGQHKVTALMRADSKSAVPAGVARKTIDYADYPSLVAALQGQQALLITMSVMAPKEQEKQLIRAAAEANVAWVMPNHWGGDLADKQVVQDSLLAANVLSNFELIESLGKSSWVSLSCGFWYEWSICMGTNAFGISWEQKQAVLYDDGTEKICTTTWAQVGRAVAALYSLPILPQDESDESVTLSQWCNKLCYVSSFTVSQRDMLASLCRVTGAAEEDFAVSENKLPEYYLKALADMKAGDRAGFARALYSRTFFRNGGGDFSHKLDNARLGLPDESLDDATKTCVEWLQQGKVTWPHD